MASSRRKTASDNWKKRSNRTTPDVELPVAVETSQFRLNTNQVFVPISAKLAPSALQWAQKRGSRETAFDFAAEVRDARSNRVVGALRDTITVKIDAQHFQDLQQRALVYQGGIILAPGEYKLKFLARENESGRIGTFEQNISIAPPQPDRLQLSSVLLSSQVEATQKTAQIKTQALAKDAKLKSSPLDVGGEHIVPSVTRVFTSDQTLYVFFQAYVPQKADANSLRAGLVFFRNGQRLSDTPMVAPTEYDEKTPHGVFPPQPAARASQRGPLHRAGRSSSKPGQPTRLSHAIISRCAPSPESLPAATMAPPSPDPPAAAPSATTPLTAN